MKRQAGVSFLLSFILAITLLLISACQKKDEITVKNNQPPADHTINDVIIGNYVNRTYISVLGREPDSSEKVNAFTILRQHNVSDSSRMQFLDSVFSKDEYYDHLYDLAQVDLLNNLDTADVTNQLALFNYLLTQPQYAPYYDVLTYEITRLQALRQVPHDLHNHVIDVTEMNRRCINNYFYDQINMGAENFVVSVFQHFLNRYPTTKSELLNGELMVNGAVGNLFLQSGQSKEDLLTIFFSSNDYYEGAVRILYKRYLFRDPTSVEMNIAAQHYINSHDYIEVQKEILSTDEYIEI